MDIVGYDILEDGGLRYAWKDARFKKCIESAAFINRSKGKLEDICGYTTSVSSGCILRTQGNQCAFCRTGNVLPWTAIPKLGKNKGKNTRKDIDKNVYKEYNSVTDEVTVDQPYLTFGITIYDERDRRLLYVLDYLHIDEIISDMIDDFLYYFPVDFEKYAESRRLD